MSITVEKEVEFDEEDFDSYIESLSDREAFEVAREILTSIDREDAMELVTTDMESRELTDRIKEMIRSFEATDVSLVREIFECAADHCKSLDAKEAA